MAKVLIVDDSTAYRLRLRQMIRKLGHQVLMAHDGEQALALAQSECPDIILMDIVMPGMNGYQAKRVLAGDDATRDIPVIFVSSHGGETDRIWGIRQGAVAYISKPVDTDELQSAIAAAMSE